jgi:hypothetical protein
MDCDLSLLALPGHSLSDSRMHPCDGVGRVRGADSSGSPAPGSSGSRERFRHRRESVPAGAGASPPLNAPLSCRDPPASSASSACPSCPCSLRVSSTTGAALLAGLTSSAAGDTVLSCAACAVPVPWPSSRAAAPSTASLASAPLSIPALRHALQIFLRLLLSYYCSCAGLEGLATQLQFRTGDRREQPASIGSH